MKWFALGSMFLCLAGCSQRARARAELLANITDMRHLIEKPQEVRTFSRVRTESELRFAGVTLSIPCAVFKITPGPTAIRIETSRYRLSVARLHREHSLLWGETVTDLFRIASATVPADEQLANMSAEDLAALGKLLLARSLLPMRKVFLIMGRDTQGIVGKVQEDRGLMLLYGPHGNKGVEVRVFSQHPDDLDEAELVALAGGIHIDETELPPYEQFSEIASRQLGIR